MGKAYEIGPITQRQVDGAYLLARLFAPFVRGETHGQAGVGLGLFIARQAADVIGATLRAESKVGAGTTFHLHLPEAIG